MLKCRTTASTERSRRKVSKKSRTESWTCLSGSCLREGVRAEIWVIRSRLQGGILNKAQRGELKVPLPTGLIYDEQDTVVLDPDAQIQESIRVFFDTFWRVGSAHSTVKAFREEGLTFPRRIRHGPCKGKVVWKPLTDGRVTEVLHNPRYAGALAELSRDI